MKAAFFLVILANLVLLMYEYSHNAGPASGHKAPLSGTMQESIVLAREKAVEPLSTGQLSGKSVGEEKPGAVHIDNASAKGSATTAEPKQEKSKAATEKPSAALAIAFSSCYQAGPFTNEVVYNSWSKQISDMKGIVKPMPPAQDIIDYLVLYPVTGGTEGSWAAIRMLRDKGIKDVWPLRTGSYKGYISLGAFRREDRALIMQKNLRDKDVNAVVKPRFKNNAGKYMLINGTVPIADRLEEMAEKNPGVSIKPLANSDPLCSRPTSSPVQKSASSAISVLKAENNFLRQEASLPKLSQSTDKGQNQSAREVVSLASRGLELSKHVCYEAGPFPSQQRLNGWRKHITDAGGALKFISREGMEISGYLVLFPSRSPEETRANLQMLRDKGISDAWPLSSGEQKGTISLGLFDREENARQLQKSLSEKDISSIVIPRHKLKWQRYAIISGNESVVASINALVKNQQDIKVKQLQDTEEACTPDSSAH